MSKKRGSLDGYTPDTVAIQRLETTTARSIAALWDGMRLRGHSFDEFTRSLLDILVPLIEYSKLEAAFSKLGASELDARLSEYEAQLAQLPYMVGYESRMNGMKIGQNPYKRHLQTSNLWVRGWFDAENEQKKGAL